MVYILEKLAIGNFEDAKSSPVEIDSFLNVAEEVDLEPKGKNYYKIPIQDFVPIPKEKMRQAINWLSKNLPQHKILVFCKAGVGRSSSVVIGYLCSCGKKFGEAVEFVAKKKPDISILPNLITTIEEALKEE